MNEKLFLTYLLTQKEQILRTYIKFKVQVHLHKDSYSCPWFTVHLLRVVHLPKKMNKKLFLIYLLTQKEQILRTYIKFKVQVHLQYIYYKE